MSVTLTGPWVASSSSLNVAGRFILRGTGADDPEPTSTLGGDYIRPLSVEEAEREDWAWAKLARRSLARWAKENPD